MIEIGKKGLEYLAVFLVGLLILAQVQGMSLEPHVSPTYVEFYFNLGLMGLITVLGMMSFGMYYFSNDEIWKLSTKQKAIIHVSFIIFIFFTTWSGNQMVGVPRASVETLQLTPETELYTSTIIPGFFEDLFYLAGLPMTFAFIVFILLERVGWGVSTKEFMIVSVVACLLAATGYNIWLLPGFTTSHIPAYGNTQLAYTGAFIFSAGQSLVYLVTGWFIPVAHMLHNLIIVYGAQTLVIVG